MFGMGTGGSLRLLSPEIGQGPNPFAAARNAARSIAFAAAFLLSPVGNTTASRLPSQASASQLRASHPQNRTGWITSLLRPRFAPSILNILSLSALASGSSLTIFFLVSVLAFGSVPSARFRSLCLSYSLLPSPYSLFPRSSPRPISITKLHALPHFHR